VLVGEAVVAAGVDAGDAIVLCVKVVEIVGSGNSRSAISGKSQTLTTQSHDGTYRLWLLFQCLPTCSTC
jgi:hypothetical protein